MKGVKRDEDHERRQELDLVGVLDLANEIEHLPERLGKDDEQRHRQAAEKDDVVPPKKSHISVVTGPTGRPRADISPRFRHGCLIGAMESYL